MKNTLEHLSTPDGCRPNCPACAAENPQPPKPAEPLLAVAKRLVRDLKAIGFTSYEPISGPDLVDLMNSCLPDLIKAIKEKPADVLIEVRGGVAECTRQPEDITVEILDHDHQ